MKWGWTLGALMILIPGVCLATQPAVKAAHPRVKAVRHNVKVRVIGAYVGAVPPTSKNAAVYLTLRNPTSHVIALTGASTPAAEAAELHQSSEKKGMMEMKKVSEIKIPAHGEVKLKPMSYHLMLIGLEPSFHHAKHIRLELFFSDHTMAHLNVPVRR